MAKISKHEKVKQHLMAKGSITSWEAINLFKATRLSAIIFNLRQSGYAITTKKIPIPEEEKETSTEIDSGNGMYAKYIYTKK